MVWQTRPCSSSSPSTAGRSLACLWSVAAATPLLSSSSSLNAHHITCFYTSSSSSLLDSAGKRKKRWHDSFHRLPRLSSSPSAAPDPAAAFSSFSSSSSSSSPALSPLAPSSSASPSLSSPLSSSSSPLDTSSDSSSPSPSSSVADEQPISFADSSSLTFFQQAQRMLQQNLPSLPSLPSLPPLPSLPALPSLSLPSLPASFVSLLPSLPLIPFLEKIDFKSLTEALSLSSSSSSLAFAAQRSLRHDVLEARVRCDASGLLCRDEIEFAKKRSRVTDAAIRKYLASSSSASVLSSSTSASSSFSQPNVGICLSGGGARAMLCSLASLAEFQRSGLLDGTQLVSGLSGSTWALSQIYSRRAVDLELEQLSQQSNKNPAASPSPASDSSFNASPAVFSSSSSSLVATSLQAVHIEEVLTAARQQFALSLFARPSSASLDPLLTLIRRSLQEKLTLSSSLSVNDLYSWFLSLRVLSTVLHSKQPNSSNASSTDSSSSSSSSSSSPFSPSSSDSSLKESINQDREPNKQIAIADLLSTLTLSDQQLALEDGLLPLPLYTAITPLTSIQFEFSPFEVGSHELRAFVPTWGFNRRFEKGVSPPLISPSAGAHSGSGAASSSSSAATSASTSSASSPPSVSAPSAAQSASNRQTHAGVSAALDKESASTPAASPIVSDGPREPHLSLLLSTFGSAHCTDLQHAIEEIMAQSRNALVREKGRGKLLIERLRRDFNLSDYYLFTPISFLNYLFQLPEQMRISSLTAASSHRRNTKASDLSSSPASLRSESSSSVAHSTQPPSSAASSSSAVGSRASSASSDSGAKVNSSDALYDSPTLSLMDAGLAFNYPLIPLLQPSRGVDVIVLCDFTSPPEAMTGVYLQAAKRYASFHDLPMPDLARGEQPLGILTVKPQRESSEADKQRVRNEFDPAQQEQQSLHRACHSRVTVFRGDPARKIPSIVYIPLLANTRYHATFCPRQVFLEGGFTSTLNFVYSEEESSLLCGLVQFNLRECEPVIQEVVAFHQRPLKNAIAT